MSEKLQSIKQRFGIIGRSPVLDQALGTAVRVAPTDLTVLITGESGVGKEVFSKIIHGLSPRKHNKFIAINCGAIPEGTINSELFGHEKGSFTGATGDRKGYFETVDQGTIFLDEIGEMPADTQAFLLRVLESGEYLRVGSSKVQKTDVRVIAATNVDLIENVRKGKFREDLYYRLNTVPIKVPALKDRPEDIILLFRKFAMDFAEKYRTTPIHLDEKAELILENYQWPGNVRELRNVAEQLSVLSENKLISGEELIEKYPQFVRRFLPMISELKGEGDNMDSRELLYQLLVEMKKDLNDLKALVFGLIQTNDLHVPEDNTAGMTGLALLSGQEHHQQNVDKFQESGSVSRQGGRFEGDGEKVQLIIEKDKANPYRDGTETDEVLSLEENEKELISKALTKHKGRRRDAARELGISERTLYRKIKNYKLD